MFTFTLVLYSASLLVSSTLALRAASLLAASTLACCAFFSTLKVFFGIVVVVAAAETCVISVDPLDI